MKETGIYKEVGDNSILDLRISIQNNHLEKTIWSKITNNYFYLEAFLSGHEE